MIALVVDDQRSARHVLAQLLDSIGGVSVVQAGSLDEARVQLRSAAIELAFIDLRLAEDVRNRDGLILIEEVCRTTSATPIVVSGHTDVADLRAAFRLGAYDYLVKDNLCEELVRPLLEAILTRRRLAAEVTGLRARETGSTVPTNLIGSSPPMAALRGFVRRVATSDRPVLVQGETGAGKEVVVQAIHALGAHPDAPLLDLNCSALPAALLESQLFGHEKGAFTGADARHAGYLAAVGEGTLFLDEIAELELPLQAKLLRVLETRMFRPVGSTAEQVFRGRVIAATHVDLAHAIVAGRFREDLYFRLNVLVVRVPPLDERREDIPALVAYFAAKQPRRLLFDDGAVAALQAAPWPGNVRQLRNAIDRIAVMCESERVGAAEVTAVIAPQVGAPDPVLRLARLVLATPGGDKLELVEAALVEEALRLAHGNKSAAARLLGVHRKVVERALGARGPRRLDDEPSGSS